MRLKTNWLFLVGIAAVSGILVLSFLPGRLAIEIGLSGWIKHILAYLVVSVFAVAGTGNRRKRWMLLVGLLGIAASAELIQVWIPGRVGSVRDFAFSATGVVLGGLLLPALMKALASISIHRRPRRRE